MRITRNISTLLILILSILFNFILRFTLLVSLTCAYIFYTLVYLIGSILNDQNLTGNQKWHIS